jgi:hypothetical protein
VPKKKETGLREMAGSAVDRRWWELGAGRGDEGRGNTLDMGGVDGNPASGGCERGWPKVERKLLKVS